METLGIIVAAGKGIRIGTALRKQYLPLDALPMVCHSLRAFDACRAIHRILLVLPETDFDFCKEALLPVMTLEHPLDLIAGGPERQDSVYNALLAAEGKADMVVIHDSARPLILPEQIHETIRCAEAVGAAILAIPATETLKKCDASLFVRETLPRQDVWIAQTPQTFRYAVIRLAHEKARADGRSATDDAQLVEHLGHPVKLVMGSRFNFKITTPEDLRLAEALHSRTRNAVLP